MKTSKTIGIVVSILLVIVFPAFGQTSQVQVPSPLSLEVRPAFDIPLGDTSQWFNYGGGVNLGLNYRLPQSIFYLSAGLEYSYSPIQAAASVSLAALRLGAGIQLPLTGGISALCYAAGGYYFATYNDFTNNANDPYIAGGIGLKFALSSTFNIEVGAQYKNYLGLYQGVSAGAGIDVALGNLGGSVDIPKIELRPAFPVFYKHYDDHPVGDLQIKSNLKVPATDVRAQVFIKEYMDAPKAVGVCDTLAPGETRIATCTPCSPTRCSLLPRAPRLLPRSSVSYKVEGQTYEDKRIETLTLWGRNAMTWDDNRKAAAYVTSKDPGVLNFARSVVSFIRSKENRSICDNLQAAIALHEAIDLYGMNYTPNPKTPYAQVSKQKDVIDFLQFPRETFQYKAGDCSDLSILYGALFQAVGIDAAFITVPGHIFIAVDTCLTPDQAPKELIPTGQFVAYKGKCWVPLEITSIHDGFFKAWQLAAKEWSENSQLGEAGFYPIQEAWTVYQPVGLPGADIAISVPQSDKILAAYLSEVQKYLDAALEPQVAKLQRQIQTSGSVSAMNSLGVLYAKFGQMDKAEEIFKQVLDKKPYLPTLLNLGHLYFRQGDWKNALSYYQQANDLDPSNPHTLLAMARVNQELQNYSDAKASYEKLKAINPDLASQYAYLAEGRESGTRAANISSERIVVLWESEQ